MHKLPIRLIGNGGGVVYAPLGPTHLATEDISIMRALPNMTVVSVCDANEMVRLMRETIDWPDPIYIRLGKGYDEVVSRDDLGFTIGKAIEMYQTPTEVIIARPASLNILLISTGVMTQRALKLAKVLEGLSTQVTVLHCHTVKPLDETTILHHAKHSQLVVTLEENTLIGGLGSAVTDCLIEILGTNIPLIKRFGLPDRFPDKYGSQELLLDYFGLSVEKLFANISEIVEINFNDILAKTA
jgi:transketolase